MAWFLVAVPLASAGAVLLVRGDRRLLLPIAVAGTAVAVVVGLVVALADAPVASWRWGPGLELGLHVTGLAKVMVVLVPAVALPVVAFAASSERDGPGLARLLALLQAFLGAMLLLVAARDLLTLLVGWELVAACSWALIAHDWRDAERPAQATQAYLTTRAGDVGLVAAAGVAVTAGAAGYADLGRLDGWQASVVGAGILLAAAAKSAQLPFSPWLFSAMAGPTPVSALLHSATMVAAGAYALARVVPALDGAAWLPDAVAWLGVATAVAGGLVALAQRDLKLALAGSTSAQFGLVLVAVGSGSVAAAGAHIVTHAAFKALLFLGAGVALHASGTLDLGRLRLGRALPGVAGAFAVGAAALAAVPPLGGARSKEEILAAAAHHSAWLAVGVLLAGFLSTVYAGRLAVLAYGPGRDDLTGAGPTAVERAAIAALAVVTVGLSAMWLPGAGDAIERATGGTLAAGEAWELPMTMLLLVLAVAVVGVATHTGRLLVLLPRGLATMAAGWFGLPTVARVLVDTVLGLGRFLARVDDRVIDAGVRGAATLAAAFSRAVSWWGERGVDGAVLAVAGGAVAVAGASRLADERAVDGAVEGVARGTGAAGRQSRRLQNGLSHHYYVVAAAGLLAVVAVAALGR